MKIAKYYEFVCEQCDCGNHPPGSNIKDCIKWLKKNGCLVKYNMYFCNINCYEEYRGEFK